MLTNSLSTQRLLDPSVSQFVSLRAEDIYITYFDRFISRSNQRKDIYGGTIVNRCRFILETIDAITEVFDGPEVISVKISPTDYLNDSVVDFYEMKEIYTYLINEMVKRKVGIITLCRRGASDGDLFGRLNRPGEFPIPEGYDPVLDFGKLIKFPGSPSKLMANNDYTVGEADRLMNEGKIDMITFGRPFIYNPVSNVFSRECNMN